MKNHHSSIENIAHTTGLSADTVELIWSLMEPLIRKKFTVGSCIDMVKIKTGKGTTFLDGLNLNDELKADVNNLSDALKADVVRAIFNCMG